MQKNKKRAYPAFIREDEGMQLVYVPDFAIFTEGHDLVDAIEMARDAIGVRRHIVGGTYRTLISVQNPLRLCRTGICRSLSAG